jgi:hypothetical protein
MKEGMQITANTPDGAISIVALKHLRRKYNWNDCSKDVRLYARAERWHGSMGIYNPGAGITWWLPCDGIRRAVVEEGQQHFESVEAAMRWLRSERGFRYVYRDDGLVVGWFVNRDRGQLNVDVWQVLVSGSKPEALEGSDDSKIEVRPRD